MIIIKILDSYKFVLYELIGFIIISILILGFTGYEELKTECYKAYLYSQGYMYIGDQKCINSIPSTGDKLLILDARDDNDPDIKIYESYKIKDEKIQKEVINKLLIHEKNHPSSWARSKSSMINEWYAHNLLYNMNFKKERTRDVDLNNGDEATFKEKLGVNTLIKYYNKL